MEGIKDLSMGCCHAHSLYFKELQSGRPFQLVLGCHSRIDIICPECAKAWRLKTRRRFIAIVRNMENPRFLTLTLLKDGIDHCDSVKKLWGYRKELFRKLRDKGYKILDWVATVELPNHMHIIMDSDYIPHAEIKEEWQSITGDSFIVDIRAKDRSGRPLKDNLALAAAYITKYVTKLTHIPYATALLLKSFHLIGSHVDKAHRIARKPRIVRFVRIDRLEFEAIFLDFYDPLPEPPPIPTGLERWADA